MSSNKLSKLRVGEVIISDYLDGEYIVLEKYKSKNQVKIQAIDGNQLVDQDMIATSVESDVVDESFTFVKSYEIVRFLEKEKILKAYD